jgi:hypothetical protein
MHTHPTFANGYVHEFCCDYCGRVAAAHDNEHEALRTAQGRRGWLARHPGWQFACPACARQATGKGWHETGGR